MSEKLEGQIEPRVAFLFSSNNADNARLSWRKPTQSLLHLRFSPRYKQYNIILGDDRKRNECANLLKLGPLGCEIRSRNVQTPRQSSKNCKNCYCIGPGQPLNFIFLRHLEQTDPNCHTLLELQTKVRQSSSTSTSSRHGASTPLLIHS